MTIVTRPERRKTRAETDLDAAFARLSETPTPDWPERAAAFGRFAATGLPHRRVEAYHYTDLRTLLTAAPPLSTPGATPVAAVDLFAAVAPARFVLVDGWFAPDLSDLTALGDGVTVASVAEGLAGRADLAGLGAVLAATKDAAADPIIALTETFFGDGCLIRVAAGAKAARPIEIRHLSSGAAVSAHVRHLVVAGAGAEVSVIESHESPDGVEFHAHTLTELVVGDEATVTWVDRQREGDAAVRLSTLAVRVGDRAKLDHSVVTLGARLARTQIFAKLGAACDFRTRGATLVRGRAHADATLVVTHAAPGSTSRELYRSVVDEAARSAFQGRISVEPAAQKTDGRMGAHAVLLSDRAEADAKPELEILADDVACAHGATVSEIDETLRFYLMSRGIPVAETDRLLIRAFLGEVTDAIADEAVRTAIEAEIDAWIDTRTIEAPGA